MTEVPLEMVLQAGSLGGGALGARRSRPNPPASLVCAGVGAARGEMTTRASLRLRASAASKGSPS